MSPVTEGITRREFLEVSAAAGLACVAGAACRTAAPAGRARGLAGPAIAPFALCGKSPANSSREWQYPGRGEGRFGKFPPGNPRSLYTLERGRVISSPARIGAEREQ